MNEKYIPERGDLVWLDFDPSKGSEQKGRRPALVLSKKIYNRLGLAYVVPITSNTKGYRIEVPLEKSGKINGVILSNQLTTIDWRERNCTFIEKQSESILNLVSSRLRTLLNL